MGMGNPFAVRIILSSFVFTFLDAGTVMFQILILIFFYLVGANFKIKMTTILYYKCLHPFSKFSSIAANVDTCIQYYFFECCLLTDIYD